MIVKGLVGNAINVSPHKSVKSLFNITPKYDIIDKDLAETFNTWSLEARYKPIIHILDEIKMLIMNMIHIKWISIEY